MTTVRVIDDAEAVFILKTACPDTTLCQAGDACAGWCKPQPMGQFYTSTQRDRPGSPQVTYLVERDTRGYLPMGQVVKELHRSPARKGCYVSCFYYSDSCYRADCVGWTQVELRSPYFQEQLS